MLKKGISIAIFFIMIINLVGATQINLIQPQQGDVNEEDIYPSVLQFCDVDWQCTQWGNCINGYKKRICVDANNCQYKYNTPITKLACTEKKPQETSNKELQIIMFGFFTFILLLILMIILLGLRR